MSISVQEAIAAAIDGKDWPAAAAAILAHPASKGMPRDQIEPLGRIAYCKPTNWPASPQWHVIFSADLLARIEQEAGDA